MRLAERDATTLEQRQHERAEALTVRDPDAPALEEPDPETAGLLPGLLREGCPGDYRRVLSTSFGFGGLTANEVFRAGARVPIARGRMYAAGSFSWRRTEAALSQELTQELVPGLALTLDSYWVNSSFGYFLARWLRMEAFYRLTHQASSAEGNVDRTRIGIQFVTSKPVRIQ